MTQAEKATGNKVIGILLRRLNKKKYFNKWKNSKDNQYLLYTINNNDIFINKKANRKYSRWMDIYNNINMAYRWNTNDKYWNNRRVHRKSI